jgi:hypothetical protein
MLIKTVELFIKRKVLEFWDKIVISIIEIIIMEILLKNTNQLEDNTLIVPLAEDKRLNNLLIVE